MRRLYTLYTLYKLGYILPQWGAYEDLMEMALKDYWGELTEPPDTIKTKIDTDGKGYQTVVILEDGKTIAVYNIQEWMPR
jgi:hypothetical protein